MISEVAHVGVAGKDFLSKATISLKIALHAFGPPKRVLNRVLAAKLTLATSTAHTTNAPTRHVGATLRPKKLRLHCQIAQHFEPLRFNIRKPNDSVPLTFLRPSIARSRGILVDLCKGTGGELESTRRIEEKRAHINKNHIVVRNERRRRDAYLRQGISPSQHEGQYRPALRREPSRRFGAQAFWCHFSQSKRLKIVEWQRVYAQRLSGQIDADDEKRLAGLKDDAANELSFAVTKDSLIVVYHLEALAEVTKVVLPRLCLTQGSFYDQFACIHSSEHVGLQGGLDDDSHPTQIKDSMDEDLIEMPDADIQLRDYEDLPSNTGGINQSYINTGMAHDTSRAAQTPANGPDVVTSDADTPTSVFLPLPPPLPPLPPPLPPLSPLSPGMVSQFAVYPIDTLKL
ncbi:predicted protein [Plenodomus lingam JN3]|uniref:Predicted protein n=1 Tax=Leptosphaeria maculans (strain JN3 / isolate v23.1.3 / race Av1-4-5-6-7-8) TaxID=985895 RepID=E4ZYD0_LEPMJ|nr:predicted protein [Plenodomus lingam JN3]CBX96375.1 predicted protein [Plenodomus lingam JN3]